jgi:hypothetical protein
MTTLERFRFLCGELLAAQNDQAIFRILPELREALQETMDERGKPEWNGRVMAGWRRNNPAVSSFLRWSHSETLAASLIFALFLREAGLLL